MFRYALVPALLAALSWSPGWLSIESPVNPYDRWTRDAVFLVHASLPSGVPAMSSVSGTAEGLVNGERRSVTIRFDSTSRPGVFAVKRQWPSEGVWLVRVGFQSTTAIISLDRNGAVSSTRVPTVATNDVPLPRPVLAREIDSTLAAAAKR